MARSSKRRSKRGRRRPEESESRGGSMMSMRQGFKRLAGSDRSKPRDKGSMFLTWLLILVFLIVLVLWLAR